MKLFLTAGYGQKVGKPAVHALLCTQGKWGPGTQVYSLRSQCLRQYQVVGLGVS